MTTTTHFVVPAPKKTRRSSAEVAADKALVATIRRSLASNPAAVVRALEVLFARQTRDEQAVAATRHHNEVGFSQADARTATWLVEVVIAEGREAGREDRDLLRGKALEMGRRIAGKYARTQLLALAKAKKAEQEYEAALAAFEAEQAAEQAAQAATESCGVPFYVVARMMAGPNPSAEEGAFWDAWKDEMKETWH